MNIKQKQTMLEDLIKFLNENNITKSNIEENEKLIEDYLKTNNLGISAYIPGIYYVVYFPTNEDKEKLGKIIYYNGKNGGWGFETNEFSIEKKEEGTIKELNNEIEVIEVNKEGPKQLDKVSKEDTTYEDFITLYKGQINDKFIEEYGDIEDKDLWEDLAKEMFLKSKYYILKGDEVKPEKVEESKEIKKEIKEVPENTKSYDAIDYFWQEEDIKAIQNLIGEAAIVLISERDKAVLNIKLFNSSTNKIY